MKINASSLSLIVFFLLISSVGFAQTATKSGDMYTDSAPILSVGNDDNSWTFYHDEENQTFFIDFENITINISEVILRNQNGTELQRRNVSGLPVDAIYELDLRGLDRGAYYVEVKSYTKSINRSISVN